MSDVDTGLAVYDGATLVLALRVEPGGVWLDGREDAPVMQHGAVQGRIMTVDRAETLLGLLRAHLDVRALRAALETEGLSVRTTPLVVLQSALEGVE